MRCQAFCACREAPVYVYGAGTVGEGVGWGAAPSDRRLTCTGGRGGTVTPSDRRLTCRVEGEGQLHRRIDGRHA